MEKKSTHQQSQAQAYTHNVEWSALSDTQKAQMLLSSTRMLDAEIFLQEFGSFENPMNNNFKSAGNTLNNAS